MLMVQQLMSCMPDIVLLGRAHVASETIIAYPQYAEYIQLTRQLRCQHCSCMADLTSTSRKLCRHFCNCNLTLHHGVYAMGIAPTDVMHGRSVSGM